MSLTGLATFLMVAERQSFSAAAAALGISRSAVSQAVQNLERSLGTPLLVRTTRTVRLTDAGARLLATAGPALQQANDALATVRAGDQETAGTVRLTVPHIAVPIVVSPALPTLRARHPKLTIEIVADDRLTDIIADHFDAGIRLDERLERHMVSVRVSRPFRFLVVASPAYLAAHGRPTHPRDLMDHECIGYRGATTGVLYRWEFERRGREITVSVPSSIITSDAALGVRAAVDGLGFAYCDEFSAAPYLARGDLEVVLDEFLVSVPGLFLYFPERTRNQPKLRALIDVLRVR